MHRPVLGTRAKPALQTQVPLAWQVPATYDMTGLSLQVWSMPTVQVEPGPTHPRPGRKQVGVGHTQTWTVRLFAGEQPQAPAAVVQVSRKSMVLLQHDCVSMVPPVEVQS